MLTCKYLYILCSPSLSKELLEGGSETPSTVLGICRRCSANSVQYMLRSLQDDSGGCVVKDPTVTERRQGEESFLSLKCPQ